MSNITVNKVDRDDDRRLPVFDQIEALQERIRDRAYELFRKRGGKAGAELDDWLRAENEVCWPAASLEEDGDEFELKVAIAGFDPDDIDVTARPTELIVKAAHQSSRDEDDDERVHWSEFRSNEVFRRIAMPSPIDVDKVKAKFKRGMLEIEAKKARKARGTTAERDVSTAA